MARRGLPEGADAKGIEELIMNILAKTGGDPSQIAEAGFTDPSLYNEIGRRTNINPSKLPQRGSLSYESQNEGLPGQNMMALGDMFSGNNPGSIPNRTANLLENIGSGINRRPNASKTKKENLNPGMRGQQEAIKRRINRKKSSKK